MLCGCNNSNYGHEKRGRLELLGGFELMKWTQFVDFM